MFPIHIFLSGCLGMRFFCLRLWSLVPWRLLVVLCSWEPLSKVLVNLKRDSSNSLPSSLHESCFCCRMTWSCPSHCNESRVTSHSRIDSSARQASSLFWILTFSRFPMVENFLMESKRQEFSENFLKHLYFPIMTLPWLTLFFLLLRIWLLETI